MTRVGALIYDPETNRLSKNDRPLSLSPAPLRLLLFFMEHAERSFETGTLIERLWGGDVLADERARCVIRTQVKRIRLAIEDDDGPWLLGEGKGRGYGLWVTPPVAQASRA